MSPKARWLRGEISNEEYDELTRRGQKAYYDAKLARERDAERRRVDAYRMSDKYKQKMAQAPNTSMYNSVLSKAKTSLTRS